MTPVDRRSFLQSGLATTAALLAGKPQLQAAEAKKPTNFQIACMTLPYSQFPFERALTGIQEAGYKTVALYTTHRENGVNVPVLAADAPADKAKEVAKRCRDLGLEPVLMFAGITPEDKNAPEVFKNRIKQAAAGKVAQILTFGHTKGGNRELWVKRFKELGPIARDSGVLLVIKQHGGETGTGEACADIVREVADDGVRVNYDAGNVLDYLQEKVDPITDFKKCADVVRSFCIKDHRNFPRPADKGQDCGPGFGQIDHWKLLAPVAFTGLDMPLCCENIFAPFVPRPTQPAAIDHLARRAREYLEVVIQGVQA